METKITADMCRVLSEQASVEEFNATVGEELFGAKVRSCLDAAKTGVSGKEIIIPIKNRGFNAAFFETCLLAYFTERGFKLSNCRYKHGGVILAAYVSW